MDLYSFKSCTNHSSGHHPRFVHVLDYFTNALYLESHKKVKHACLILFYFFSFLIVGVVLSVYILGSADLLIYVNLMEELKGSIFVTIFLKGVVKVAITGRFFLVG